MRSIRVPTLVLASLLGAACAAAQPLPATFARDGLAVRAETRVTGLSPRVLHTQVTLTNTTQRPLEIRYGDCALRLRAYRTPERTGRPVWLSEHRRGVDNIRYVCLSYLQIITLAPGESMSPPEFQARIPFPEVHGDSLPDGRYYLSARLSINHPLPEEFPAGEVELTSRRDPPPAEETFAGVRYRAETRPVPGVQDLMRFTLTLTNTTGQRREVGVRGPACAVWLHAAASEAERAAWYLPNRTVWSARDCLLEILPFHLVPGESRTLATTFRAPAQRPLYFVASVVVREGERHQAPERVVLAAGEVEGR